jgi:enolase-phosphatase E1
VIVFDGRGILLDVEGTTSSIAFVYDVLFEHAKKEVGAFLSAHRSDPHVLELAAAMTAAAQAAPVGAAPAHAAMTPDAIAADPTRAALAAIDLMNCDVKDTSLKALQGMIWRSGFESGQIVAHVFDDVPPALSAWADAGLDVRIYSSGSIEAQQLFFRHTSFGDLTPSLRGNYDTTTGPKRDAASYEKIAAAMGLAPRQVLFVSDIGAELDAARAAGMQTALAVRPGNGDSGGLTDHPSVSSFAEIVT